MIERRESYLNCSRVVEASISAEVHMQALGQRYQALNALWAIKECRGTRHHKIEAWVAAGIDLIDPLAQRVEALFPCIRAHALQRFDFVKNQYQACESTVPQDGQDTRQEISSAKMIHTAAPEPLLD